MRTLRCGAVGISTEFVLLRICTSENEITKKVESKNSSEFVPTDATREINQITSLESIGEWNPSIQAKSKHETKTI